PSVLAPALPLVPMSLALCTVSPYTTLFRSGHGQHGNEFDKALGLEIPLDHQIGDDHAQQGGDGGRGQGQQEGIPEGLESLVLFRSEEHTSELQSRFELVCRLLLEKKKDIVSIHLLLKIEMIRHCQLNGR